MDPEIGIRENPLISKIPNSGTSFSQKFRAVFTADTKTSFDSKASRDLDWSERDQCHG